MAAGHGTRGAAGCGLDCRGGERGTRRKIRGRRKTCGPVREDEIRLLVGPTLLHPTLVDTRRAVESEVARHGASA
jgi:hypothetical protein